jgi:hypothetical protein
VVSPRLDFSGPVFLVTISFNQRPPRWQARSRTPPRRPSCFSRTRKRSVPGCVHSKYQSLVSPERPLVWPSMSNPLLTRRLVASSFIKVPKPRAQSLGQPNCQPVGQNQLDPRQAARFRPRPYFHRDKGLIRQFGTLGRALHFASSIMQSAQRNPLALTKLPLGQRTSFIGFPKPIVRGFHNGNLRINT